MRAVFALFLLFLTSCNLFEAPRGSLSIKGSFLYFDVESPDSVTYRFSLENGQDHYLVRIPLKELVQLSFDDKKDIPYRGSFEANIVIDQNNRIDKFELIQFGDKRTRKILEAKDVN